MKNITNSFRQKILLFFIILLALFLRFIGLNWDQGYHLHPDERFLTMVAVAMQIPPSINEYLDPAVSKMNPANINYSFFVYGLFPISFTKVIAVTTANDTYDNFTLLGRLISGTFDVVTLIFIFLLVKLLEEKYKLSKHLKFFAAFLYAIAVLPIQLSHFFAVDTFLTAFLVISVYFAVRFWLNNSYLNIIISAGFFGLAMASKITAIFMLPLIMFFIGSGLFLSHKSIWHKKHDFLNKKMYKKWGLGILLIFVFMTISYFVLRITNPYMFNTANIFNPAISELFIKNLETLKSWETVHFPPAVQWIHKTPILFSLWNMVLFGIGIPYTILLVIGIYVVVKRKYLVFILFTLWTFIFFIYQSTQFVKALRYLIFLYPFFAIFAAFGLHLLLQKRSLLVKTLIIVTVCLWTFSFIAIYSKPHSRLTASQWIYDQLPNGSMILGEYWDDPLPLTIPDQNTKRFQVELLPVFDPDTPEKWGKIDNLLLTADYYILSSNRGWGSIPTVPEHYPQMTKFYNDLLAGKTQYKLLKEFTSYPSLPLLGEYIYFSDDFADETFTVYDHPKVMIFINSAKQK